MGLLVFLLFAIGSVFGLTESLPACSTDEAFPNTACIWNAEKVGPNSNGEGRSFINLYGVLIYLDNGQVEDTNNHDGE